MQEKKRKGNFEMDNSRELLNNLSKLYTTELGVQRIKRNLKLGDIDVVDFCRKQISSEDCTILRQGKNWYCSKEETVITVNAYSYTIITAHIKKTQL